MFQMRPTVRGPGSPVIVIRRQLRKIREASCVTAKAGGTTRRPLVLQMDRGRILFDDRQRTVDHILMVNRL